MGLLSQSLFAPLIAPYIHTIALAIAPYKLQIVLL